MLNMLLAFLTAVRTEFHIGRKRGAATGTKEIGGKYLGATVGAECRTWRNGTSTGCTTFTRLNECGSAIHTAFGSFCIVASTGGTGVVRIATVGAELVGGQKTT